MCLLSSRPSQILVPEAASGVEPACPRHQSPSPTNVDGGDLSLARKGWNCGKDKTCRVTSGCGRLFFLQALELSHCSVFPPHPGEMGCCPLRTCGWSRVSLRTAGLEGQLLVAVGTCGVCRAPQPEAGLSSVPGSKLSSNHTHGPLQAPGQPQLGCAVGLFLPSQGVFGAGGGGPCTLPLHMGTGGWALAELSWNVACVKVCRAPSCTGENGLSLQYSLQLCHF